LKLVRGKGAREIPKVFLAAFGKHPGWDDHIEDIGIETEHLAGLKQVLYVQGIGGTIDSGAWDKLTDTQRIEGFRHVFIRRDAGGVFVGRLWSSRDGKGRTRYPMVVCAQCVGVPMAWALREIPPRLEAVQERCVATTSANDVIALMDNARLELRQLAEQVPPDEGDLVVSPRALAELADREEMGPDQQGLLRILYQIEREMSSYLPGNLEPALREGELRPQQIRLPACSDDLRQVAQQWFSFMLGRLDPATPLGMIFPLDRPWVDVFVGEPSPQQFFCLQASREALPLASEIPYTLDDDFVDRARQALDAARTGEQKEIVIEPPAPPAAVRPRRAPLDLGGKLAAAARSSAVRWALALVLATALVVAGVASLLDRRTATTKPTGGGPDVGMTPADAKTWETLCTTFYDWFGSFLIDLDRDRLARWQQDPHLKNNVLPALLEVQAETLKLDPRRIANCRGSDLRLLGTSPPTGAKEPEVIGQTRRALDVVRSVQKGLSPDGWPTLARLKALAAEYNRRGWRKQARYVASMSGQIEFAPGLAAAVDHVAAAGAQVDALEALWRDVQAHTGVLEASGSDLLALFGQYVRLETQTPDGPGSAADLAAMASRLSDVDGLAAPLAAYVQGDWQTRVDKVLVQKHPPVAPPASPEQLRGGAIFRTWHAAIQGQRYRKLDPALDPRRRGNWEAAQQQRLAAIRGKIDELKAKHGYEQTDQLHTKLRSLETELDTICKKRWDQDNRSDVTRDVLAFKAKPASLDKEVRLILARLAGGRKAFLASISKTISESAVLNALWQKQVEPLRKITDLDKLTTKVQRLEADLTTLDEQLPFTLGVEPKTDWGRKLDSDVLFAQRDRVLSRLVAAMAWQDGSLVQDAKFKARWKQLREEFDRWRGEGVKLMVAFDRIAAALDAGALPDEQLPSLGTSPAKLYAEWKARPIFAEKDVRQALKPVTNRLDRLAALAASSDRAALTQAAARAVQGRFEAARAAWLRLGTLAQAWPANPAEFAREREIHGNLAAVYALLKDENPKAHLQQELVAETRRRWEAYFASRTDAAESAAAVERMGEFYLDLSKPDALQPINRFRVSLHAFRRQMLAPRALEDAAVTQRIGEFAASVARLPGGVAAKEPVAGFLAELRAIAAARDTGTDLTKAGPALANWRSEISPDGSYVKYAWASAAGRRHSLGFVRIEPQAQKPSYLCTTEVSVGLFLDVVNARNRAADVGKLLREYASPEEDPRRGPQVWVRTGPDRAIATSDTWTAPVTGVGDELLYAKGLKPDQPDRAHPMQHVSAQAAVYLARLLGCRLPTGAEWTQAYLAFEKDHANKAVNRRDRTWARQRDHVNDMERQGKFVTTGLYPDEGAFWPKGFSGSGEGKDAKVLDTDDGTLWFAKVDAGQPARFHHLLGNVAEFVFEAPEDLDKLTDPSAPAVQDLLRKGAGTLRVIGASALSDPKIAPTQPYPVEPSEAAAGYADVGFRLAFTAPAEALHVRLRRLLNSRGYLPARGAK
jgi:hypothetical protein